MSRIFEVTCPKCGTGWELGETEAKQETFTCENCSASIDLHVTKPLEAKPKPARLASLCDVMTVVIRLQAIYFFVNATLYIIAQLGGASTVRGVEHLDGFYLFLVCLFIVVMTWWFFGTAPWLAGVAAGRYDGQIEISSLTLRDLFRFAFLITGLFMAVSDLHMTVEYFFLCVSSSSNKYLLYSLARAAKVILGVILIVKGGSLADKLIAFQNG